MVVFLTLPPDQIPYPYILINARRPEEGIRYIRLHSRAVEMVIIDSGVEIFRDPGAREYPGGPEAWIARLVELYTRIRSEVPGARVYAVCPDYPDDYRPGALWIDDRVTNIERTVLNVLRCIDWYPDVGWLIPVQGWYRKPRSLLYSLEYLEQLGVLDRYSYLAVANLCVERCATIVRDGIVNVYRWLRERGYTNHALHVFGLKISALPDVARYIRSFDSRAWTRPVSRRLWRLFNWSAKNIDERALFFCEYLAALASRGVYIPRISVDACIEILPHVARRLGDRYASRSSGIARLVDEIINDLTGYLYRSDQP